MQTSPIKAIREHCIECCGGSSNEVKLCTAVQCPLYAFRFGKNPYRKSREMSEQEKEVLRDRLANARKQHRNTVGEMEEMEGCCQ